ncbi:MAG: alpha/beta fold hydrolase, partial [Bacteroidota bacterium]
DWLYVLRYLAIDGLRQAYADEGLADGEVVLLLHGQPSWSYLYRHMIPPLVQAGYRVIAMDHLGMGRSDKPIDPDYYTFSDYVHRLQKLIRRLELQDINLFVQDWGSVIGLYTVGTHPDWFARVVVGNGALPNFPEGEPPYPLPENIEEAGDELYKTLNRIPAKQPEFYKEDGTLRFKSANSGDGFARWITYARHDERFRAAQVLEAMTYFRLTDEEEAACNAPFLARIAMGAPRSFPGLANTLPGVTNQAWEGLSQFNKPFLTIWGGNDPGQLGQPETQQILIDKVPGAEGQDHTRLPEASHFLQDDQGEEITRRMITFFQATDQ